VTRKNPEPQNGKKDERAQTLYVTNREEWRRWLRKNHDTEKEIWLIYYKKQTGRPCVSYDDLVEEALCFGWIDSIVKRIDDQKYARKLTPRKLKSKWSALNKGRVAKMIREGRMSRAGLDKISFPVQENGSLRTEKRKSELPIPGYLEQGLRKNKKAWENFKNLAPSCRRDYVSWITSAKQEATRMGRLSEAVKLLEQNKKLGLK
jgi:uncharacterized protein YdeI (YjbR/CyaY-like superfamily)